MRYSIKSLLLTIFSCLLVVACISPPTQAPSIKSQHNRSNCQTNCRTIQHIIGEACVPENPQRVIVLDTNPLDAALSLGVEPVGIPEFGFSLFPAQTKKMATIGNNQPNLEIVALLQPDLILGNRWNEGIYDRLSQIAPTVIAPSVDSEWKEDFKLYAKALNRTQEAEQLLKDYHDRIHIFQRKMGSKLRQTEVSIVTTINYGFGLPARVYLGNSFMGSVVEETGLSRPLAQKNLPPTLTDDNWGIDVSIERLDLTDGDVIFVANTSSPDSKLVSTLSVLKQNPLWSALNAVQEGRVYPVDYYVWVAQRNIGGANRILDDLHKYLIDAL